MPTLTNFVKTNAKLFAQAVVNPVGRSSAKLEIEPISSSLHDAVLAGHAFDLWVRCWLASRGVIEVEPSSVYGFPDGDGQAEQAAKVIRQSINRGAINSLTVLRSCLTIALFEAQSRSGVLIDNLSDRPSTINELRQLTDGIDLGWLTKAKSGINNPQFGVRYKSGRLIHADGDLILDGNLIEIKTARRRNKQMEGWRQIAGYIVLNSMRPEPLAIEYATLWYVRFGEPLTFPVDAIFKPDGRDMLRRFFEDYLNSEVPKPTRVTDLIASKR